MADRPLEDAVRQFQATVENLFKRRPPGAGNGAGGHGPSDGAKRGLGAALVILLALWGIFSAFYTVDVSEEAVVTRFGAYTRTAPSGMHFKLPFGIEEVTKIHSKMILQEEFGFRTRNVEGSRTAYDKDDYLGESLMLTGDLNVADVEWILQYRISDPWKFLFKASNVTHNIRDVSLSIMRRVVGDRLVGEVLTTKREEIAAEAKQLTQDVLDQYDMGVRIEKVILQGVNPPEKVKPAFNEANAAMQEQEKMINNAEQEYNRVVPEARGKAAQVIADAEAYAIDTVNHAKGDAALFASVLAEYRKDPEITRRRIYLETMEEVFSKSEVTVVDKEVKGLLPIHTLAESTK